MERPQQGQMPGGAWPVFVAAKEGGDFKGAGAESAGEKWVTGDGASPHTPSSPSHLVPPLTPTQTSRSPGFICSQ